MTIRHLTIFKAVVEANSISGAADKLFISQPAVSHAILELEQHYNIKLFDRIGKRIYLTEFGKEFYKASLNVINSFDELEMSIKPKQDIVSLGSTLSIGTIVTPTLMINNKNLIFNKVFIENTKSLEKMLLENDIDLALIEGVISNPDLKKVNFMSDEIVFICSPKINENYKSTLLLRETGSGTRDIVEKYLSTTDIHFDNIWTLSGIEGTLELVKNGFGITAISKNIIKNNLEDGSLQLFNKHTIKREFNIVYHKNKFITSAMQQIIDYLCKE